MGFSRQEYWSGVQLPSPSKPIFLTEKSHGQRSLEGYSPWDIRADTHTHTHTHTHWEKRLCYFKAVTSQNHKVPDLHYQTYSSNLEHILLFPFTSASVSLVIVIICLFENYYRLIEKTLEQKQKFTLGLQSSVQHCICLLQFSGDFPTLDLYSLQIQKAFHYFTGCLVWWESNSGNYRILVEDTSFGLACQLICFCLHWLNFFWDASSN